jgi:hypothetical protein
MVVLGGNFTLGCGSGKDYPVFQCMLEWTDAITNGVLEPIMHLILAKLSVTETHLRITALFGLQFVKRIFRLFLNEVIEFKYLNIPVNAYFRDTTLYKTTLWLDDRRTGSITYLVEIRNKRWIVVGVSESIVPLQRPRHRLDVNITVYLTAKGY